MEEARELPVKPDVDLVELDGALETFAKDYPRKSEVVELKFFGGLGDVNAFKMTHEVNRTKRKRIYGAVTG